jgi:Mannosyl-glycoprotein endo-beta-N-acetylglucosaminidase
MVDRVIRASVTSFVAAAVITIGAIGSSGNALAAELPEIKASAKNTVPACTTPGRLMAYIKSRNGELDSRFNSIAIDYMRVGEELGMRWDYAFFQMISETGALSFKNGNRHGDVNPKQNNFAGLGATGNGEAGESFKDVTTGVKAHLQHIMLYAGSPVDSPVAERTRKVQEWGVLTSWQKGFKRPITYADLASKWAPKTKAYSDTLESIADKFADDLCKKADPHPEMLAQARGENRKVAEKVERPAEKVSGATLARKAIADGKAEKNETASGLGATQAAKAATPGLRIINAPDATPEPTVEKKSAAVLPPRANSQPEKAIVQPTAAPGLTAKPIAPPASGVQKCRVWTASYGGQKAMIIKAIIDGVLNYTVLDVNEGQEAREADAFIAAYAKGGAVAGEFQTQTNALDKAFELCPEG